MNALPSRLDVSSAGPAGLLGPQTVDGAAVALLRPMDRDDELLALITTGDEAAFRELVARHVDRAYALAYRLLRQAADAEDVVQDTLLKIWSHRGSWNAGRARFSTWLYRVVTNRCLDLLRRPRSEDMDAAPEMVDTAPDAALTMERQEVSDLLAHEIQRLPDQQRIALILSYYDELSNAQIAEIMDTTVQAVESLLKRGRQQLRKQLSRAESDIRQTFTGN